MVCQLIPHNVLSKTCGCFFSILGPLTSLHDLAMKNLSAVFPHLTKSEKEDILKKMWFHYGQVFSEFVHLKKLLKNKEFIEFINTELVHEILSKPGPKIIYTGHIGNWEILPIFISLRYNISNVGIFFSPPTNKYMRWFFDKTRHFTHIVFFAKGENSIQKASSTLSLQGTVGMLIDQRLRTGINIPFFGHDSKITTTLATLAKKHKCPVIPVHSIRKKQGGHYIRFSKPIYFHDTGSEKDDIEKFMTKASQEIEKWIKENPSLWLWAQRKFEKIKRQKK